MALAGRPLSSMGPTFAKMGDAAKRANVEAVERSTKKLGVIVNAEGRRFHIKGRRGNKVPLSAKTDVRGFNGRNGLVVTGAVRGIPEGFWVIVEYGSAPHSIVRSKQGANGRRRKVSEKSLLKSVTEGTALDGVPLLSNGAGGNFIAPYVLHPGHGSLGKPWEAAMRIGAPMVANEMQYEQQRALIKAFT